MTPQAYLYICDGDIDHPVLTHKKMNWPEKYPHWQEIPLVMAKSEHTWVGLTAGEILDTLISVDEKTVRLPSMLGQFACAIEAKLKEKNT